MRKFTNLGHVPNRSGHCINNHKTGRTLIISPGCATLSCRSAAMQLLGKKVPDYFLDDDLHKGIHGYVMTEISSLSTDLPPDGYECLQLVRNPLDRLWAIWLHVLKWQMNNPEGSMSIDNMLKTMISWEGRNTALGEFRFDVHLIPQSYRAPFGSSFVKIEEDGYARACEWIGVEPVENKKKDREKMKWRERGWASEGRHIAEALYICDFHRYGYSDTHEFKPHAAAFLEMYLGMAV